VLADTGALFALADHRDEWHERMREWWREYQRPLTVPVTVLPEAAWLLGTRLGPRVEAAFVRGFADGAQEMEPLAGDDLPRAADLMLAYADLPLGFVDASIVAMAERLDITTILTTDRRHFGAVRPSHCERLRLVP
jgi:hypothetical protein